MRILIAEDHPKMRACIQRALDPLGASFVEASDGASAVAAFRAHQPDWTLMDIEMPGMDGLSAARAIREIAPSARILMLTAFDSPALRAAARAIGNCHYVLKSDLHTLPDLLRSGGPVPPSNNSLPPQL